MGNSNDKRQCRSNNADQLEERDIRNYSRSEANNCHHRECDRFADILAEAYNDGYKQGYCDGVKDGREKGKAEGYCDGFKDGREKGRVEGFQAGCKSGQEKAKEEVLDFIKRNRCCRCCCKQNCC